MLIAVPVASAAGAQEPQYTAVTTADPDISVDNLKLLLKDPAPTVKLHELGDSSVNFICRPWTQTANYWAVYWDITRTVKERFDAEGVSIPFPQQDVHIYHEAVDPSALARALHGTAGIPPAVGKDANFA